MAWLKEPQWSKALRYMIAVRIALTWRFLKEVFWS